MIPEDHDGHIDLAALERAAARATPTGRCRSARSRRRRNVTGIVTDTHRVADLLHRHGALSFWDFAAAAPYVDIDMNAASATQHPQCHKDAIFLTPHKFIGGPGTPGVLVVRRRAAAQPGAGRPRRRHGRLRQPARAPLPRRPRAPRGGRYAGDHRVDPGRPGLPAQAGRRRRRDPRARGDHAAPGGRGVARTSRRIEILGNLDAERLSIVSFVVRRPGHGGRPLPAPQLRRRAAQRPVRHPVARRLLVRRAVRAPAARHRHRALARVRAGDLAGCEGIKPGWVRINFNYFISEAVFDYIVDAVDLVAEHGWRLLARLPVRPGDRAVAAPATARSSRRCGSTRCSYDPDRRDDLPAPRRAGAGVGAGRLPRGGDGRIVAERAAAGRGRRLPRRVSADFEHLRWFELPAVCLPTAG